MLCFASHGQPNCHSSICVCTQVKILNIGTEREGNLDDRRNALYTFTRQLGSSHLTHSWPWRGLWCPLGPTLCSRLWSSWYLHGSYGS